MVEPSREVFASTQAAFPELDGRALNRTQAPSVELETANVPQPFRNGDGRRSIAHERRRPRRCVHD